ncbi:CDP-diacylglycerol diphosphatase [Izhakiella australiensis]|uniref:CDP-diacylglycerol pyrophosphatase n=1 Tax=Izhakiella australiensis TaxID=1926881 RepID=A0A1S8YIG7_9GAMM|nr:CDP-diacylglycerol diphosphatase [Izhakiella australiensis]OON38506.1 CDP-diacylglycerol diphosphatase [Izhakiella australiensis]
MQGRKPLVIVFCIVILLAIGAGSFQALTFHKNSDALWRIISQQCIPDQVEHHNPAPCRNVDLRNGFVVMKDRNGPLQFLLMPTERISGIESTQLLHPAKTNFFAEAWYARHYAEELYGKPLNSAVFSLAVNSPWGRSQDQLHIHISCLRPDIRQRLDALAPQLDSRWRKEKLDQHEWLIRTVTRDEFNRKSPFIYLANGVPGAWEEMGHYGIAVASLNDGRRAIMVIKRNLLTLNRASAEEIQDHSCALVYGHNSAPAAAK